MGDGWEFLILSFITFLVHKFYFFLGLLPSYGWRIDVQL